MVFINREAFAAADRFVAENARQWGHNVPPVITDDKLFDTFYFVNSTSHREFTEEHRRVFTAESTGEKETPLGEREQEGGGA